MASPPEKPKPDKGKSQQIVEEKKSTPSKDWLTSEHSTVKTKPEKPKAVTKPKLTAPVQRKSSLESKDLVQQQKEVDEMFHELSISSKSDKQSVATLSISSSDSDNRLDGSITSSQPSGAQSSMFDMTGSSIMTDSHVNWGDDVSLSVLMTQSTFAEEPDRLENEETDISCKEKPENLENPATQETQSEICKKGRKTSSNMILDHGIFSGPFH